MSILPSLVLIAHTSLSSLQKRHNDPRTKTTNAWCDGWRIQRKEKEKGLKKNEMGNVAEN